MYRSFEFAPVDGALRCDIGDISSEHSFGDRLWTLIEEVEGNPHLQSQILLLFNEKSRISEHVEDQTYISTLSQRAAKAWVRSACTLVKVEYVTAAVIPNRLTSAAEITSDDSYQQNSGTASSLAATKATAGSLICYQSVRTGWNDGCERLDWMDRSMDARAVTGQYK